MSKQSTSENQQPATSNKSPTNNTHSSNPKKLLIVTYYWPPSGGSGVQRWLKFVKYLPQFGWQPFVFTPENPSFEIRDDTLLKDVPPEAEVIQFPIWEPYGLFGKMSRFFGRKSVRQIDMVGPGNKGLFQNIASWIRGNLFIPDARILWVKPSVEFLADFLKSNNITTLVTTGPPHSVHLIGLRLKKKNPELRWIADFRDPWSEWDLLDSLSLTRWARHRHQRFEKEVLTLADKVITIAPYHVTRLEILSGRKVDLVTNGFDDDDFKMIHHEKTSQFTVRHIGMVDELRDPRPFMQAVKKLMEEDPSLGQKLVIEFIGSVNTIFRQFVSSDKDLSQVTVFRNPIPHGELLKLYSQTDVQLLILAHTALAAGNLPGKFFEYLASGNFIFGIGPTEGDAAKILLETNAGIMIERDNGEEIQRALKSRFEKWLRNETEGSRDVSAFTRKSITGNLVSLLNG